MAIDTNKKDFEQALSEMKDCIDDLDSCIGVQIMNTLKSVINEYDTHFESDICDMITENESMKDALEQD